MSVIITEMDMPNTCHKCKYSQCYFYDKAWVTIDNKKDYRSDRDKTCPLKSVKGLIERLQKEIDKDMSGKDPYGVEKYKEGLREAIEHIKEYCDMKE